MFQTFVVYAINGLNSFNFITITNIGAIITPILQLKVSKLLKKIT